jgi:hypothetical protein
MAQAVLAGRGERVAGPTERRLEALHEEEVKRRKRKVGDLTIDLDILREGMAPMTLGMSAE